MTEHKDPPAAGRVERIRRYYRVHLARFIEAYAPWATAGIVFLLVWAWGTSSQQYDKLIESVMPNAVTVASILAGFQGALYAILLSLLQSRVIRQLKKKDSEHEKSSYEMLVGYIALGVNSLALFVVFGLLTMIVRAVVQPISAGPPVWPNTPLPMPWLFTKIHLAPTWAALLTSTLAGVLMLALHASYRVVRLLIKLLRVSVGDPAGK